MRPIRFLILAATAAGSACGGNTLDRHVEDLLTIDQGVYGQVTARSDLEPGDGSYVSGLSFAAYAVPAEGTVLGGPEATGTSGERGFFEIELPAGDHVLCPSGLSAPISELCVQATVATGSRVRLDYSAGDFPGWSGGEPWPPASGP